MVCFWRSKRGNLRHLYYARTSHGPFFCTYTIQCTCTFGSSHDNFDDVTPHTVQGSGADQDDMKVEVTFNCRFCYQLNESDYTCTNNTSCNVRGSPMSVYTANCSANENVFCLRKLTCTVYNTKSFVKFALINEDTFLFHLTFKP